MQRIFLFVFKPWNMYNTIHHSGIIIKIEIKQDDTNP